MEVLLRDERVRRRTARTVGRPSRTLSRAQRAAHDAARAAQGRTDKAVKETELLQQKVLKVARETDDEAHTNQALLAEAGQKQMELNVRTGELNSIRQETSRQKKLTEQYARKVKALEEDKVKQELANAERQLREANEAATSALRRKREQLQADMERLEAEQRQRAA